MSGLARCAFHHLGLAVRDDGPATTLLRALGYALPDAVIDPLQNVRLRFCTAPGRPAVEIVQPGGAGPSPVDGVIARHGDLIYHVCYETPDLDAALQELKVLGLGFVELGPRFPAVLFGGRYVSFYRVRGVGTVEFLESA